MIFYFHVSFYYRYKRRGKGEDSTMTYAILCRLITFIEVGTLWLNAGLG
jgi:hypothetical protein